MTQPDIRYQSSHCFFNRNMHLKPLNERPEYLWEAKINKSTILLLINLGYRLQKIHNDTVLLARKDKYTIWTKPLV